MFHSPPDAASETGPPEKGWGNHATVMGYFLHRLLGERTLYRGVELRGGNHGFLRSFTFDAPTFDPALNTPIASARSLAGNHSVTALTPAGKLPDSPTPRPKRAIANWLIEWTPPCAT